MKISITCITPVLQAILDFFPDIISFQHVFHLGVGRSQIEWKLKAKTQISVFPWAKIGQNDHSNPYIESTTVLSDRSNSRQNMILDYNENSTAQYMYKQAVIHTKLSNRLYPIQYISQHDTARQYRTCIMDSDMASVLIRSLCIQHLILNNVYCTSWSCLI